MGGGGGRNEEEMGKMMKNVTMKIIKALFFGSGKVGNYMTGMK